MSVQTTLEITRERAEEKAQIIFLNDLDFEIKAKFQRYTDEELEDYIEEEFYNFSIK